MVEELPAFSDHLLHAPSTMECHTSSVCIARDTRKAWHVQEHRPGELEVGPKSITQLCYKWHAQFSEVSGRDEIVQT